MSSSFELSGKLIDREETVKITETFSKREFVIEINRDVNGRTFTDFVKFQLVQDKCALLDNYNINDTIKVNFNIRGRKWEKDGQTKFFNSLDAWRISGEQTNAASPADDFNQEVNDMGSVDINQDSQGDSDDLPF